MGRFCLDCEKRESCVSLCPEADAIANEDRYDRLHVGDKRVILLSELDKEMLPALMPAEARKRGVIRLRPKPDISEPARELLRLAEKWRAHLSDRQHRLAELYWGLDRSQSSLASELGISANTVYTHLRRVRDKLIKLSGETAI